MKDTYSRKEQIDSVIEKVRALDIHQVMMYYCPSLELTTGRFHEDGFCPFHGDTKKGSFKVTPQKGLWYCFTEQIGGDDIKFVSMLNGTDYLQSAFQIASDFGVITYEEYEKLTGSRYEPDYSAKLERKYCGTHDGKVVIKRAPETVCDKVYRILKESCGLSREHKEHLIGVRHLDESRIREDYFTFPSDWRQKKQITEELLRQIDKEILITVPGFFYDKKYREVSFCGAKGIGILIRNAKGLVTAVQIRKDALKNENDSRYKWMSSAFCEYDNENRYEGGCGCGSPKDTLISGTHKGIIGITEGRFKSEILVKKGITMISVQGVGQWDSGYNEKMGNVIRSICRDTDEKNIRQIISYYDADILGNYPNFCHCVKMCISLSHEFKNVTVRCAYWHKSDGKGIDDFLLNGHDGREVHYMHWQDLKAIVDCVHKEILGRYGIAREGELEKEQREAFRNEFQEASEKAVDEFLRKRRRIVV